MSMRNPGRKKYGTINRERKWHIGSVVAGVDAFPHPLPGFNIKGRELMKTFPGGVMTALILIVIIFYAGDTLIEIINRE